MNDIAQIDAENARAIERAIPDLQRRGYHVVAEYAGLAFVGSHHFRGGTPEGTAHQRAHAKLAELNASGNSTHGKLHAPTAQLQEA